MMQSADNWMNKCRSSLAFKIALSLYSPFFVYYLFFIFDLDLGPLFFGLYDIFADNLKSGLAYRSMAPELEDPAVLKQFPIIIHEYYLNNQYLGPHITRFHAPPLTAIQLMTSAKFIVLIGPYTYLMIYLAVFIGLCLFSIHIFKKIRPISFSMQLAIFLVLAMSYPALFMMQRANVPSGLSSIGLVIYMLTVISGRYRWVGYLCLAIAIGFRPNTAVVGFLEFVVHTGWRERIRAVLQVGLLAAVISLVAMIVAMRWDPEYTINSFLNGLRIYYAHYATGPGGFEFNFSLYGITRTIPYFLNLPTYTPWLYQLVHLIALLVAGAMMWLGLRNRLTAAEGAFLSISFTALFTPVFALYHLLCFAAPLLAVLAGDPARINRTSTTVPIVAVCIVALGPIGGWNALHPIAFFAGMIAVLVIALRRPALPA